MKLKDFLIHSNTISELWGNYLDKIAVLDKNSYDLINLIQRGLYIEACEQCSYSKEELQIFRQSQINLLELLANSRELLEARKRKKQESKKKEATY